jgi:hypothetical protein
LLDEDVRPKALASANYGVGPHVPIPLMPLEEIGQEPDKLELSGLAGQRTIAVRTKKREVLF